MSKLVVVWITVVLAVGIIFAGHAEEKTSLIRDMATEPYSSPVSSSTRSDALDTESFPTAPDMMILALPFNRSQEACWVRVTDYQRQVHSIMRAGHGGAPAGTGHYCKFTLNKQSQLEIPASSLGALSSASPQGIIMRL